MRRLILIVVGFAFPIFGAFPDICEKCWYEVPNSNISDVFPSSTPPGSAGTNFGIIEGNGGAFDSRRNRLIVTGGRINFAGNQIYAFDVDSLKWFRITDGPSVYDEHDTLYAYYLNGGMTPDDQQPRPGGNYDQVEYDSTTDNLFIFGSTHSYSHGHGWPNIHQFNLGSGTWSHPTDLTSQFAYGGSLSARDPATGKIWVFGNGGGGWMSSFAPGTGVLTDHGDVWTGEGIPTFETGAIMPPKNRFIAVGSGVANYWPIVTSGNSLRSTLSTTGCDSLLAVEAPGFEWSPVDHKMVGWAGGTKVITMDTTYTCAEVAPSVSNTVTPEAPLEAGTYGRWRYVAKYNVFVVVSSTTGNVYFYRHSLDPNTQPEVVITSPSNGYLTNLGTIPVSWTVNGTPQTSQTTEVLELEGSNLIERCSGGVCDSVTVTRDQTPPVVIITSPSSSTITGNSTILVKWTVDAVPDSQVYNLEPGTNLIIVSETDLAGNIGADTISVTRGTYVSGRPIFSTGANLVATNIRSSSMTLSWPAATASEGLSHYVLYRDGVFYARIPGDQLTYTAVGLLINTVYEFRVEAVDDVDQISINGPMRAFRTANVLPPDPATIASAVPQSQPTLLGSSVAFLYQGGNSVQTGVVDSLMDPIRTVVLKGAVRERSGSVLSGATVSILNHSELGSTVTRANGEYDLVVNGGGPLVVVYAAGGYLEAQKTVSTRWQEYLVLDTVALVSLDTLVTTVDLSPGGPMQVVQASVVTDGDGSRQATLLVPTNTAASMVTAEGDTVSLDSMSVRATEYTVGPDGLKAMPGVLPGTSGYTYALEYTVDEAAAAGAKAVIFENPIYGYVENFVGIPVGYPVPAAYYDKEKAVWIPSDDGRVIKIAAINAGEAELVVDTSGATATEAHLDSLGITSSERIKLADLYSVNQTLWRVPIRHFSSADYNFPVKLPDDKEFPKGEKPKGDEDPKGSCGETEKGSVIDCHRQSLGETVKFPGLPSLNYRSHRVPSRRWNRIEIAVTGSTLPASVDRILLNVTIAGRKFQYAYTPATNIKQVVEWDGLDAYGRRVKGRQPYTYSVSYGYVVVYAPPPPLSRQGSTGSLDITPRTFGIPGLGTFTSPPTARLLYDLSDTYTGYIGAANIGDLGPGWTLEAHHVYDPTSGLLHRGDGSEEGVRTGLGAIYTVAGGGEGDPNGSPARDAWFGSINGMDIGPDGSLYLADRDYSAIFKVGPDGVSSMLAQGHDWFDVTVAPDGDLYLTEASSGRIWRLTQAGDLSVVAGSFAGFGGDGGPAIEASLGGPNNAVVGRDGSIYIADRSNSRVRRVSPDGLIQTVAGTGTSTFNGDSLSALETNMSVNHIDVGDDGSIYISDVVNCRIRKVDPSGIVSTLAGTGNSGTLGDGGPALEAEITADRIRVVNTKDGGTLIYLSDDLNNSIRVIDENGIINRVAGGGANSETEGLPALSADLQEPRGLAVDANGNVYIGEYSAISGRVRKILGKFPDYNNKNILIPSPGTQEVYQFSPEGRHLKTFNSFTGAELLSFSYNTAGYLTHMTDVHGNVTEIERTLDGKATALVNPYDQTLALEADAEGNLEEVALPSSVSHSFTYNGLGLLATYTTPGLHEYQFTYDSLGRLTRDDDPAGGFKTVAREDTANGVKASIETALERTSTYKLLNLPDLSSENIFTDPSGIVTRTQTTGNGVVTTLLPDGTERMVELGPEPQLTFQGMVAARTTTTLPSSLVRIDRSTQEATFEDPLNPLTLTTFSEFSEVNGNVNTSLFSDSLLTWYMTTSEGRMDSARVDSLGRVVERGTPGIERILFAYDNRGRLDSVIQGTGPAARTIRYTYNEEGYPSEIEDAEGRIHAYTYNLDGQVTQETLPGGRVVQYSYDADGNLASIAPPGKPSHFFDYNAVGLDTLYEPPALGVGNWNSATGYNLDRQLLAINRPGSQDVQYRYDASGRLDSILSSAGAHVFYRNPVTGQVDSLSSPYGVSTSYGYDGNLTTSVTWSGLVSGNVSFGYDSFFRIASQSVNGMQAIETFYDRDGLPTYIGALHFGYDENNGRLKYSELENVIDSVAYNEVGEVEGYLAKANTDTLFRYALERDKLGRITQKTETVEGVTRIFEYRYDSSGRLEEVELNSTLIAAFTYDSNGNRLTKTHPGGVDSGFYDDQDRIIRYGSTLYSYNSNGDLELKIEGGDTTRYQYDAFGSLMEVNLPDGADIEYVMDGQNRRVGKKINGILRQAFLYQGELAPIAELDSSGAVVARFIYGARSNVPDYVIILDTAYKIVSDQLGSVRMVVNAATGQIAQRLDYDEFGRVVLDDHPGFQPFGYAGGLYDRHTDLVRFGARDYDSKAGRWTNKDPIKFLSDETNLYVYVNNDPINAIDPQGLISVSLGGGAGWGGEFTIGYDACGWFFEGIFGIGAGLGVSVNPVGSYSGPKGTSGFFGGAIKGAGAIPIIGGFGPGISAGIRGALGFGSNDGVLDSKTPANDWGFDFDGIGGAGASVVGGVAAGFSQNKGCGCQ